MAAIDSSSWPSYATIDPEFEALIPHLPPAKSFADYASAADLRATIAAQVEQLLASGIVKLPDWTGVEKKEVQIPARDAASLRAVVYRPESTQPGPLAVYFHGGGWTFGWPESWEHGFAVLTKMGITCVGVAYRLAPENVFPTAVQDTCDSLKWCAEHAGELGADPGQGVLVLGTSAGANMAAVASHEAIKGGWGDRVRGVVLMGGGLVHCDAVPEEWKEHYKSWEQNKDAPVLDVRGTKWFFGMLDWENIMGPRLTQSRAVQAGSGIPVRQRASLAGRS
ncbi:hypothetical protein N0V86_008761 [Didymella sp. IMI 355093]|nr:hypothetical protein N0V86_008761 [Didymella sp. IMI 355093]